MTVCLCDRHVFYIYVNVGYQEGKCADGVDTLVQGDTSDTDWSRQILTLTSAVRAGIFTQITFRSSSIESNNKKSVP